jgi:integrase
MRHCRRIDDPLTELFELLICTGMCKGEPLGLHWADVELHDLLLFVRHTLVTVENSRLVFTAPKTIGSRDWIALSTRAITALRRRHRRNRKDAVTGPACHDQGLVFCRPDGRPLRHEQDLAPLSQGSGWGSCGVLHGRAESGTRRAAPQAD